MDDVVENVIGNVEADLGAPVRRAQVDLPAAETSGVVTAEVWLPPGRYARFALEPEADEVRPVRIDDAQSVHALGELRSNEALAARLDATSRLSKAAVWQLRHPIDMGRIFDGGDLAGPWTRPLQRSGPSRRCRRS